MLENFRRRSANVLISLLALTIFLSLEPALADESSSSEASAHILQAEIALQGKEYLTATIEYRKASELSDSVELARKATRLGFSYGFNDEALIAAKRWVKLDKDSDEARAFLGQLYFRLDDLRNSRRQFERLIKSETDDPGKRLLSLLGYLADEDRPEQADKLMRALAKPYRDSAMAQYAVAVLALQAGDVEHAKERATRSMQLDPNYTRPKLLFARALMFERKTDEAIDYLAHLIGDSPQPDPDARMELALMYMLAGRDDDALSQVNQVSLEQGGRLDALRLMAIINFRLRRLDAAWDDFQDLLASGQYRVDALYYLGRISDYREQYERAVRLYREVDYGSNTIFSQGRASYLLAHQLDNVDAAFKLLDEFADAALSNAVDAVSLKAQLFVSLKRFDEGLALFDKAIEYRPDNEGLVLGRSDLLLRIGRIDEGVSGYRNAVKRWPDSAMSLNALGYTLADRTEEFKEAEKLIRKALAMEPDSAAIIDSLGWVLFKLGKYDAALAELQRAYERMPDHEVASHVVDVLFALERNDEALEFLETAEKKDPDSELLKEVRDRHYSEAP